MAATYVDALDTEEILRRMRINGKILKIVAVTAAFIALLWAATVTAVLLNHRNNDNGYFVVQIVEGTAVPID